jgi:putative inorganic carbon (hco3(-)) transporter
MRDIAVSLMFLIAVSLVGRFPWSAPITFMWLSVMNPHKLAYGFATQFPFAMLAAVLTLLVVVFSKMRKSIPLNGLTVSYFLLILWMSLTAYSSINPPSEVFAQWIVIIKIHVMIFATISLVFEKKSIDALVWVLVLSLAYFGVKGGIWTVLSGGQYLVWGPPSSVVEGNNELGLGLVMMIPLMTYLYTEAKSFIVRFGLVFSMFFCMIAVLGTHSRGALLALVGMAAALGVWSRSPVRNVLVLTVLIGIGFLLMPESWTSRMSTISDYQDDASAMSRINTWTMIWELVKDRPVVGAGFRLDNIDLYLRYLPSGAPSSYGPHSIYFQAAGEHGFVGLGLYLSLFFLAWIRLQAVRKAFGASTEMLWAAKLAKMVEVSLIGFLTGASFLGLMHWDVPFYLLGLAVILGRFVTPDKANLSTRDSSQYSMRWSRHFD